MKAYVVDSAAVRSNLQILKDRAGSAVLWAVLKGDGYGLGLVQMAAICREAGVTHFAVTEVSEVSRLRAGGFQDCDILMLRPTADAAFKPRRDFDRLEPERRSRPERRGGNARCPGAGTRQDRYRHGPLRLFAGRAGSAAAHFQVYARPARDRHLYASAFRVLQSESDDCAGRGVSGRSRQAAR